MKTLLILVAIVCASCAPTSSRNGAADRWDARAHHVTIIRDDWGVPHVRGNTDADAVFGLIYAQAEDDFPRVERNYLNALGRLAEAEGESAIFSDLRMRLYVDPKEMKQRYETSPAWLQALMRAWADGLNYYLYKHPEVSPRVITRYEPWMALSFSEGSIGGDIERISLRELEAFYGGSAAMAAPPTRDSRPNEPTGSNGIAIAPANSRSGHALLWINPHTSFFFRAEVQVTSDEGLNAYGAVTWGQFFVYQGFNEHCGWMHTSSNVDNIDEYLERVVRRDDGYYYEYGTEERPLAARNVTIAYKTATGTASRTFTVYRSHHGPIVRSVDGKWVSVRLMEEPVKALMQSYLRTKATGYASFRESMDLHTNSSNNTVFADAAGNIAYFHANFIPKRDARFDWTHPVDGRDPATEWQGVHDVNESPNVFNPATGWVYNTNNWPYSSAGADSPRKQDFPAYMETGTENPRGVHAMRVLEGRKDFTIDTLRDAAFDSYLPAFADLIPILLRAYDATPESDPLKTDLSGQIELLRDWDYRWSAASVATTLAVYWGDELWQRTGLDPDSEDTPAYERLAAAGAQQQLRALATVSARLASDFGTWKTPWGEVSRFQRLTGDIVHRFDDGKPSIPVPFVSSRWGSLASFGWGTREFESTKKFYGTAGNSFVAAVEFGDRVHAKAINVGGESGHPESPHFNDQAIRYSTGDLREVYFYPEQLIGHTERAYHPGE